MRAGLLIRNARESDAAEMARVLVASIRELCGRDHGGAEGPLELWLANKTPDNVRRWLANRDNIILVAEIDSGIAGVGGLQTSGTVILNYVAPTYRFQGVSKAMMTELESRARQIGLRALKLESTRTAHAFYVSLGYEAAGQPGTKHDLSNFPMIKLLR